jgi:hypothetical protein
MVYLLTTLNVLFMTFHILHENEHFCSSKMSPFYEISSQKVKKGDQKVN